MNSKYSFLSAETEILGLARHFDFVIKLTEHDSYQKLINGDVSALATYAHEWTHYIQYLSTSLGDLLAETERNIYNMKNLLAFEISRTLRGKISIPLVNLLDSGLYPKNENIKNYIQNLKILATCQTVFHSSWNGQAHNIDSNLSTIRLQRPFKLDAYSGTLIYTPDGKPPQIFRISATQIFEHAAKAIELVLENGIFSNNLFQPEFFDYFGLFLYLYQEGFINFETAGDNIWRVTLSDLPADKGGTFGALMLMFICCQVALTLYSHPNFFLKILWTN